MKKNQQIILLIISTIIVFVIVAGLTAFVMNVLQNTTDNDTMETNSDEIENLVSQDTTTEDTIEVANPEESQPESTENVEAKPKQLSYTNDFFPLSEINYDDSWEFNTTTQPSRYDGIVDRTILLTKGDTTLTFVTQPPFPAGCGPFIDEDPIEPVKKSVEGSQFDRYDLGAQGNVYVRNNILGPIYESCALSFNVFIRSNIEYEQLSEYYGPDGGVIFWMNITVEGSEYIDEADEIIANSVF